MTLRHRLQPLIQPLWHDTLFRRLFLLMWAALVGSHLVAFGVVRHLPPPWGMGASLQGSGPGLPPLATLPPGGPLPDLRERAGPPPQAEPPFPTRSPPRPDLAAGGPGPAPGHDHGPRHGPPELPARLLWLDYGVRVLLLGVAAWWGARWLTVPARRLAEASTALAEGLRQRKPVPLLDEAAGTVEVRQAAQAFNAMAQQLRQQFDAQALLMAGISHDLRTPLTRLRLRLETADADGDDAHREACIADVQAMDALIGSVLQMVRAQQQHRPPQRVQVLALLQALVDDLAEQGADARLVAPAAAPGAEAAAPPEQATVLADPLALQRVFDNLLGNALRYGGAARVGLTASAEAVLITIDDDGPGIPEAELDAVFQPFYRVSALKDGSGEAPPGGHGLGLYIARDLLRHHHGTLKLANRPEGGLRASVHLPRSSLD